VNSFIQSHTSDYNSRWIKTQGYASVPGSYCADTLFQKSGSYLESYYISGCGGPYYYSGYTDSYHDFHSSFYRLLYLKKGTEEWGTRFDTANWVIPNPHPSTIPESESEFFKIYPNPTSERKVIVEFPEPGNEEFNLQIYSLLGVLVCEKQIAVTRSTIDLMNYSKGMYFFELYKGNRLTGLKKVIIN
jgi:hypothetical protein